MSEPPSEIAGGIPGLAVEVAVRFKFFEKSLEANQSSR
jgi:hypothetical protein